MKNISLLILSSFIIFNVNAQEDTISKSLSSKPKISLMGYIDAFYAYDFNTPSTGKRQNFIFNFNRHNEFNINLGLLQLNVDHEKYRAKLAFQTGTYPQDNYTPEQELMSNINRAHVGLSLNKQNNLWFDVGIFPSNLGFESALSIKNYTLSRSLVAESSPYYLAGAKLSYEPSDKWAYTLLVSNGWQKIMRTPGNSLPSFGTQIQYRPSENLNFNWSTYVGPETSHLLRQMRYFSNFYAEINADKKLNWILGFDNGYQEGRSDWFAPVVIGRYNFSSKYALALRAEYFKDENQIIINAPFASNVEMLAFSANFDYKPFKNIALRIEGRYFEGLDGFNFANIDGAFANNFSLLASMAILLDREL